MQFLALFHQIAPFLYDIQNFIFRCQKILKNFSNFFFLKNFLNFIYLFTKNEIFILRIIINFISIDTIINVVIHLI